MLIKHLKTLLILFRVTVVGDRSENVTTLVRQVAYLNTREFPAPGKRLVHLATTLHCKSGKTIHLVRALLYLVFSMRYFLRGP